VGKDMNFDNLKTKKVLYVEDDEAVLDSFTKILRKVFGEVLIAKNGQDGLELFDQNKDTIDFVIADIKMPKMDGLTMSDEIKKISPEMPCIITTAHAEYEYLKKADEIGIYKYITKPLNITDLLSAISESAKEK
jgi:YesN/AraC family two-component response regulator